MIHQFFLETRNYEQDSSSHINNANFLRYLEEARVKMMEEKKFEIEEVHKESVQMILYKYICNYKKQIKYPEKILVQSKQIQTKKVRGILRQEILNEKKELCLEADAYWAYHSIDKSKQEKILQFALRFGGNDHLEIQPLESKKINLDKNYKFEEIEFQVRPYEIDAFQHVNNSVYANYFEIGRWDFRKKILGDENYFYKLGLKSVITNLEINFLKPCFNLEELVLKTYITGFDEFKILYFQEIKNKLGEVKSTSNSTSYLIDSKNKPVKFDNFSFKKYTEKLII